MENYFQCCDCERIRHNRYENSTTTGDAVCDSCASDREYWILYDTCGRYISAEDAITWEDGDEEKAICPSCAKNNFRCQSCGKVVHWSHSSADDRYCEDCGPSVPNRSFLSRSIAINNKSFTRVGVHVVVKSGDEWIVYTTVTRTFHGRFISIFDYMSSMRFTEKPSVWTIAEELASVRRAA
jgi:hypothetical protein